MLRAIVAVVIGCTTVPVAAHRGAPVVPRSPPRDPQTDDATLAARIDIATLARCRPRAFALDAQTAFVWCDDGTIHGVDIDTYVTREVVRFSKPPVLIEAFLQVNANELLYAARFGGQLFAVPKAGGNPRVLAAGYSFTSLVVAGADVYFGAFAKGVFRVAGGPPAFIVTAHNPVDLVLDTGTLYYTQDLGSPGPKHLFATSIAQPSPGDLAEDVNRTFIVADGWLYGERVKNLATGEQKKMPSADCADIVREGAFVFARCGAVFGQRIGADTWTAIGTFTSPERPMRASRSHVCAAAWLSDSGSTRIECLPRPASLRP